MYLIAYFSFMDSKKETANKNNFMICLENIISEVEKQNEEISQFQELLRTGEQTPLIANFDPKKLLISLHNKYL